MGESVYERRYAEQGILLKHPTMYEMKQKKRPLCRALFINYKLEISAVYTPRLGVVEIRARHEGRGFSAWSVQVVRNLGARSNKPKYTANSSERRRCKQFKAL